MSDLPVQSKTSEALGLIDGVRARYSQWYEDPIVEEGGTPPESTKDTELIASTDSVQSKITSMGSTASNSVVSKMDSTNLISAAGTSCGLDSKVPASAAFGSYANGINTIANGDYLDNVISVLTDLNSYYYGLADVKTKMSSLDSSLTTKTAALSSLIGSMGSYESLKSEIMRNMSMISTAGGCNPTIYSSFTSLSSVASVSNPNLNTAMGALSAVVASNPGVSIKKLISEAQTKMIADNGYDTSMEEAKDEMDSNTEVLLA